MGKKLQPVGELSQSEALFAFFSWLATREEVTTLSEAHSPAATIDLLAQFIEHYEFDTPRDGWQKNIKIMKDE